MRRRNVVVLASYSPSLVNFRAALIKRLVAAGYAVVCCGPADRAVATALMSLGADFRPIGPRRTSLNPVHDLVYLAQLLWFLVRLRPHGVIAYTAKPVIWGCLAAWLCRVEVRVALITGAGFAFSDDERSRTWAKRVAKSLYRATLRRASVVVFQNPDDQQEFERAGLVKEGASRWVHGSGVEVDQFVPAKPPGNGTFLLIARLLVDKGIREYAQAAGQVRKTHPDARFRLVGWFDQNPASLGVEELEDWVQKGWVDYLGRKSDVRPAIADCDVYVLPSYREGTPRTVLEAMAMGRPIITTDVPGCRQTVVNGVNGFIVPPRDTESIAQAMRKFLEQPELVQRMGAESRQMAEQFYDATRVAEDIVRIAGLV